MTDAVLTKNFNQKFGLKKTVAQISSARKNHRILGGRSTKKEGGKRPRMLTTKQEEWLRVEYKKSDRKTCLNALNKKFGHNLSLAQLISYTKRYKIHSGRTGHFPPGHKLCVGRKGKKNRGSFKKGNIPANRKKMMSERISKDGYVYIKIDEKNPHTGYRGRFVEKHRYFWEQVHGPVPAHMVLVFRDGNKQNCNLDNLLLVTRSESILLRNLDYVSHPDDLKPSVEDLAKLQSKIIRLRFSKKKTQESFEDE